MASNESSTTVENVTTTNNSTITPTITTTITTTISNEGTTKVQDDQGANSCVTHLAIFIPLLVMCLIVIGVLVWLILKRQNEDSDTVRQQPACSGDVIHVDKTEDMANNSEFCLDTFSDAPSSFNQQKAATYVNQQKNKDPTYVNQQSNKAPTYVDQINNRHHACVNQQINNRVPTYVNQQQNRGPTYANQRTSGSPTEDEHTYESIN